MRARLLRQDYGWRPLIAAAYFGHEAIVRLLLEAGANKEAKNNDGQTPLIAAAYYGHEAVVRLLLGRGGHGGEDKWGNTALDKARNLPPHVVHQRKDLTSIVALFEKAAAEKAAKAAGYHSVEAWEAAKAAKAEKAAAERAAAEKRQRRKGGGGEGGGAEGGCGEGGACSHDQRAREHRS